MTSLRVLDDSPNGRVVVRSFRKLSQVRRSFSLTSQPKTKRGTDLQKHHFGIANAVPLAGKKRPAKAKGLTKKKKLSMAKLSRPATASIMGW